MRKEETAVLDWLWYRFTQLVMNQRRVQIAITETSTVNILGRGPRKAQTGGSASVVPGREGAAAG